MEMLTAKKINDKFQYCYAVFVGDKKITLPLSEADAKKIADRYNRFEELEQENIRLTGDITVLKIENNSAAKQIERLKLQNEILSGAYETSQRLEAKYAALLDVCKKIASEQSAVKRESHILDLCNVLDEI